MTARIPGFVKMLYPRRIWSGPATGKTLYLTFDDGPIPQVTPWVLDELKRFGAKATFFCIGKNIKKNPDIFQRIITEGHSIGNHTYNHLNGWKSTSSSYYKNVMKAQQEIKKNSSEKLGAKNGFFRPPYGRVKSSQARILKKNGFRVVMWDILSMDFDKKISPQKCFLNVTRNARPGSIIVFHDSIKAKKNMMATLPAVLEHFSKLGYTFKGLT